MLEKHRIRNVLLILVFSIAAMAVMGYHPGMEDDAVYLSAVKADLNPALYPHDAEFFRVQLEATVFDKLVAGFVHLSGIPLATAEFLLQFATILLTIVGCRSIASLLFAEERSRWGGVAATAAQPRVDVLELRRLDEGR